MSSRGTSRGRGSRSKGRLNGEGNKQGNRAEGMEVGGEWVEKEEVKVTQERQTGESGKKSAKIITYHMMMTCPVCIHRRR